MVPLTSLWLPIVVSAVIVFLASWIIHMFLPFHRNDFAKLPNEDAVLDALRSMNIPSGQYGAPYANSAAQMKQPEYIEKRKRGPALFLTLMAGGDPGMGKSLLKWFLYLLAISLLTAYLARHGVSIGTRYLTVFKFVTVAAFMAYAVGHVHQTIWYHQGWRTTVSYVIDGLIYSLLTAGVFASLWPS